MISDNQMDGLPHIFSKTNQMLPCRISEIKLVQELVAQFCKFKSKKVVFTVEIMSDVIEVSEG